MNYRRARRSHILWLKRKAIKYGVIPILLLFMVSCSAPRTMIDLFESSKQKGIELTADRFTLFPPLDFDGWLEHTRIMGEKTPNVVRATQMGISFADDTSKTYFCRPSAFPHYTIDTSFAIPNKKDLIGDWRKVAAGVIDVTDTLDIRDSTVERTDTVSLWADDDVMVKIDERRYSLFAREGKGKGFKKQVSKKYELVDGRFLLLYTFSLRDAATNFIGITDEGYMIVDNYNVQEKKMKDGRYIYSTAGIRMIFEKM